MTRLRNIHPGAEITRGKRHFDLEAARNTISRAKTPGKH
jgi:hypothetical protein